MNQVIKIPYGEGSRWVVVDEHHQMINPIMKYIKYLDQIGRSANTLKSYAYQLKVYWDFLKDIQQSYENMDLNLLANFMAWLRNPMPIDKVSYIEATTAKRRERTINLMIQCVINFYDYLHRIDEFEKDIKVSLMKQIKRFRHSYRPFLDVIGTPLKNFDDREHVVTNFDDGAVQDFYTLTDIQVDKIIKAPESSTLKTDEDLTIIEPISYIESDQGKRKITYEDYTELKQNEKSIIFLKQNTQGVYSVINMDLGKFPLSDTSEISRSLTSEEHNSKEEFRKEVLEKYDLES